MRSKPAFFSWLGVAMYLANQTPCSTTLRLVHGRCRLQNGTVFDYTVPAPAALTPSEKTDFSVRDYARACAAAGEPFRGFFGPTELEAALTQIGYRHIEDLNSDAINARYFADRTDNLKVAGAMGRIVCARG